MIWVRMDDHNWPRLDAVTPVQLETLVGTYWESLNMKYVLGFYGIERIMPRYTMEVDDQTLGIPGDVIERVREFEDWPVRDELTGGYLE